MITISHFGFRPIKKVKWRTRTNICNVWYSKYFHIRVWNNEEHHSCWLQEVNVIPIYLLRFENSSTCRQRDFKNLFGFLFLVFHLEVVLTSAHKLTYSSPQNLNLELIFKKASCFRHFLAKSMLANYTISRKSQHNAALYLFIF